MAARVTATEVKEIITGCSTSDAIVDVYIGAATLLIDSVFASDTVLSDDQLKELERWFTAHMIASVDFRTTSEEKLGEASVKYTGKWGEGLRSTPYGQMVLQLDVTGKIAKVGKGVPNIYAVTSFDD